MPVGGYVQVGEGKGGQHPQLRDIGSLEDDEGVGQDPGRVQHLAHLTQTATLGGASLQPCYCQHHQQKMLRRQ